MARKEKDMRKPRHIKNAILRMRKISVANRVDRGVRWADELLKDLEKDLTFEQKVALINEMQDLASLLDYELGEPVYYNLFKQSKIQRGLKGKLWKTAKSTEWVVEVVDLLDFIQKASKFEESWTHEDALDMIREFRLVSSLEEWNELIKKSENQTEEFTVDIFGQKKYEHIRIAHVTNKYWDKKVQKHKDKLIEEMGYQKFWKGYYRYFEIWYNQLIRGTYYIFIPELM